MQCSLRHYFYVMANKKYKLKVHFDPDNSDRIDQFCRFFALTRDPLFSYNLSHMKIQEVRASYCLQSPDVWAKIFEYIRQKPLCHQDHNLLNLYDEVVANTGLQPFQIFHNYRNEVEAESFDDLKKLYWAKHFFLLLNRTFFLKYSTSEIKLLSAKLKQDKKAWVEFRGWLNKNGFREVELR